MRREWALFAAVAALLLAVPLVVALVSGDEKPSGPAMSLERAASPTGLAELLITVREDFNVADTTRGARTVALTCWARNGRPVFSGRYPWPLEVDGQEPAPHIHQPASSAEMDRIDRCEVFGTRPRLQARLPPR